MYTHMDTVNLKRPIKTGAELIIYNPKATDHKRKYKLSIPVPCIYVFFKVSLLTFCYFRGVTVHSSWCFFLANIAAKRQDFTGPTSVNTAISTKLFIKNTTNCNFQFHDTDSNCMRGKNLCHDITSDKSFHILRLTILTTFMKPNTFYMHVNPNPLLHVWLTIKAHISACCNKRIVQDNANQNVTDTCTYPERTSTKLHSFRQKQNNPFIHPCILTQTCTGHKLG